MSDFANIPVGKQTETLDVSPKFDAYSGVEIIVSENTSFFAGNRSGRVLSIENPWGTQAQAQAILASLTSTGFQYQPYTASGAILNPAAEIGDAVTVNGVYSGIYKMSKRFGALMDADIEAPQDEELDHEYPYEPKQDRKYNREIADARAQISVTQDAISAEVYRATTAEEELSSAITQTASSITASVLSKTGGSTSSFGWTLTNSSWTLYSGGREVFKATSSGISVGGGNFKVTSSGNVSANNMTLTGTLTVGGQNITASVLRQGAQSAYNNGGTWSTGAGYGYNYNAATQSGTSNYPSYFTTGYLYAKDFLSCQGSFNFGGSNITKKTKAFYDRDGNYVSIGYLAWY